MQSIAGFDFFPLGFDEHGKPTDATQLPALLERIQSAGVTDTIFLAHGFRNSELDATGLYTRFLTSFRTDVDGRFADRLAGRKYAVAGIYWPSKPFREEDDPAAQIADLKSLATTPAQASALDQASGMLDQLDSSFAAQDRFADLVRTVMDAPQPDPTEGLDELRTMSGSAILQKIQGAVVLPTADDGGDGGAMAISTAAGVGGGAEDDATGSTQGIGSWLQKATGAVGHFLNLTLWYVMKNRCGVVGAAGAADAVRAVGALAKAPRIHLVGHSLGGRLMAACAKSLAQDPVFHPDSLALLEAAFSHFGFSANNGFGKQGFFRDVVAKQVVKGPVMVTFSAKDTVVGHIYAIASRLADDNTEALGDANDPFGGIGRNGPQKTDDVALPPIPLRKDTTGPEYVFPAGKLVNFDGSSGTIADHGDVTNAAVTFAFACAVAGT